MAERRARRAMTIKDLIEKLEEFPKDMHVSLETSSGGFAGVEKVTLIKHDGRAQPLPESDYYVEVGW